MDFDRDDEGVPAVQHDEVWACARGGGVEGAECCMLLLHGWIIACDVVRFSFDRMIPLRWCRAGTWACVQ